MISNITITDIWDIKRVEDRAAKLGFKFGASPFGDPGSIHLYPLNAETLPAYNPKASMYSGTLNQIDTFLAGIEWARRYDTALGLKTDDRRIRAEKLILQREMLKAIKNETKSKV